MEHSRKQSDWLGYALKTPIGKLLIVPMLIGGVLIYPGPGVSWFLVGLCLIVGSGVSLGILEMYLQYVKKKNDDI